MLKIADDRLGESLDADDHPAVQPFSTDLRDGVVSSNEPIASEVESLKSELAKMREALEARDRFLAVAAHELRNPMVPLVLQIGLLLKSARRGEISRVTAGLELLETIINRYVKRANVLLDVTRLASDRVKLEPARFDISALVQEIVQEFSITASQGGCALRLAKPDRIEGCWDRIAVEQILENLLSNAIKFGAGKPIDVTLTRVEGKICLAVRDHGPGIALDNQQRIFAPFEKIMSRAEGGGFGVGLWVVNRLVGEMGGEIELDSAIGHGATFSVFLPIQQFPE